MDTIAQLFRFAYVGGAIPLDKAQRLYRGLVWVFLGPVVMVIVGWLCNLAGLKGAVIVLSLILAALTTIVWFEPVRLALVAVVGAVAGALPNLPGNATSASVAQKFLLVYVDVFGKVLLWGSALLFTLGTIPFGENPFVIFGITAGLLLLAFMQWQWKIGSDRGKRLFYGYVCAMIILFIFSLVPGPVWEKYSPSGWNPTEIGTTQTEDTLHEIRKELKKKEEKSVDEVLRPILKKLRNGDILTPKEENLLRQKGVLPKVEEPSAGTAAAAKPGSSSPSVASVLEWKNNHWFWILIACGFAFLAPAVSSEKVAKFLPGVAGVVLLMLFIVLPIIGWFGGSGSPKPERVAEAAYKQPSPVLPNDAPDLPRAWNADGTMTDVGGWPRVQIPLYGNSVSVPAVFRHHLVWGGSGFEVRCIYSDGREGVLGDRKNPCNDGDIVSYYFRDARSVKEGDIPLIAAYAYARMGEK